MDIMLSQFILMGVELIPLPRCVTFNQLDGALLSEVEWGFLFKLISAWWMEVSNGLLRDLVQSETVLHQKTIRFRLHINHLVTFVFSRRWGIIITIWLRRWLADGQRADWSIYSLFRFWNMLGWDFFDNFLNSWFSCEVYLQKLL